MLSCLKVEAIFDCPGCGRANTVSALDQKCVCAGCGKEAAGFPLFSKALAHDEVALDALLSGRRAGVVELGAGRLRWWSERPMCPDCGVSLDPDKVLEAAKNMGDSGEYKCPRCRAFLRMRRPTPAIRAIAPTLALLLDEKTLPFRPAGVPLPPPSAKCEKCAAPLDLSNPDKRVVTCAECQHATRIPDDVWVRLQPGTEGLRFHLFYEEDPVYLHALKDTGLDEERRMMLFAKAPLPEAALAQIVPGIVEKSFHGGPALAQATALALNRHVPPGLIQRVRPGSADEAWQLLERDDLPLAMVLDVLRDPLKAPGNADLLHRAREVLEGNREWRGLVAKVGDPALTPAEAQTLVSQPYFPDVVLVTLKNPALPEAMLVERSKHDAAAQLAILENPSIIVAVLQHLATAGETEEVRKKALAHPRYPKSFWKKLFG